MLRYKFDVLQALKDKGYNTTCIREFKLFGEKALQQFRRGEMVGIIVLEKLCQLLNLQPGDIIEYVSTTEGTAPLETVSEPKI